jgi:hypothetical protein
MNILQKRESLCPVGIKLDLQRRIQDHSHFKTIYIYLASCESSYTTSNAYQKDELRGLTSAARIRVPVPLCAPFSYNRLFLLSSHLQNPHASGERAATNNLRSKINEIWN